MGAKWTCATHASVRAHVFQRDGKSEREREREREKERKKEKEKKRERERKRKKERKKEREREREMMMMMMMMIMKKMMMMIMTTNIFPIFSDVIWSAATCGVMSLTEMPLSLATCTRCSYLFARANNSDFYRQEQFATLSQSPYRSDSLIAPSVSHILNRRNSEILFEITCRT